MHKEDQRRHGEDDLMLVEELKAARKRLTAEIKEQKREAWRKLWAEIDNNPWGQAYQIVTETPVYSHRRPSEGSRT